MCKRAVSFVRFLPEANTRRRPLGAKNNDGKTQRSVPAASTQPCMKASEVPLLKSSIQSELSPSSSRKPRLFTARNSLMRTPLASAPPSTVTDHVAPAKGSPAEDKSVIPWPETN